MDVQWSSMNIFIVEDSLAVYERLSAMLQDVNQVRVVGNAKDEREAVAALAGMEATQDLPDAIILDIQLAEGSGINVLKYIKKQIPQILIVVLTNHATQQYRELCEKEGADYFFDKSTEFMQVPEALMQAIVRNHKKH